MRSTVLVDRGAGPRFHDLAPGQTRNDRAAKPFVGVLLDRTAFDNPVVGHTRITHPRVGHARVGPVRLVSIAREGEWQLSTTVQ